MKHTDLNYPKSPSACITNGTRIGLHRMREYESDNETGIAAQ